MATNGLVKLAPMAVVGGLAAYGLMPLMDSGPGMASMKEVKEPPRIESNLLIPSLDPPMQRNPFEIAKAPVAAEKVEEGAPAAVSKSKGPSLPEGLYLGGTMVHGRRRAAIINGKVYSEGEDVPEPEDGTPSSAPRPTGDPAVVAAKPASGPRRLMKLGRVERDRVWLEVRSGKETVPLALVYTRRNPGEGGRAGGAGGGSPAGKVPGGMAAGVAYEPGSLEHLNALAQSAQYNALMGIAQRLLGGSLVPPGGAPGGGVPGGLDLGALGLGGMAPAGTAPRRSNP